MNSTSPRGGDGLARVRDYTARDEHRVVGLMTGTSADAVDAVLVRFRGQGARTAHETVLYLEVPLDAALRREVLAVAAAESVAPERLMRLDAALGECYAAATLELLAAAGMDAPGVDAIGLHGQTVRHVPREGRTPAASLQLGSAAVLAERTGITVVSDFRARDTAAGGEGAPLVPLLDWWLFRSAAESRVLLNLGGMANLTYLPAGGGLDAVLAFDTGPGNAVMDALAAARSGGAATQDRDGASAARGRASREVLAELLAEAFFSRPPPRSTGRERFGEAYAAAMWSRGKALGLSDDDIMATALELTALSIADAITRFVRPRGAVDRVVASGGGVRNPTLMRALAERLAPIPIEPADALGVPADGKEALAFAFLAHQTLSGLPGNVPGATGAAHAAVLGHITPGGSR